MEWLKKIKYSGFIYSSETPTSVKYYSKAFDKSILEQFIKEFSIILGTTYTLYIEDEHILSIPGESEILPQTLNLCSPTPCISIELKKSLMIPPTFYDNFNVHIYSNLEVLIRYIKNLNFIEVEQLFFYDINKPVYIILYDDIFNSSINNDFIVVGNISALNHQFEDFENKRKKLQERIKARRDNIRWNKEVSSLPPDVFFFKNNVDNELIRFFNKNVAKMCVAFTSLYTDYELSSKKHVSIYSGLKQTRFELELPIDFNQQELEKLFSLYNWAYSDKTTDKIGLIQNIVNINVKEEYSSTISPLLTNIEEVYEMVNENYRVYIQNSVQTYLDERNKVEGLIHDTTNEITKQISSLTDIVTKNLFGLLATAITAVIGFNKPENQDYIPWILYVYSFFSIALTIYYSTLAVANKKVIIHVYSNRITEYKKIFKHNRVDQITGNSVQKHTSIFRTYLHWTIWPSIIISILVLCFGLQVHGFFSWLGDRLIQYIIFISQL